MKERLKIKGTITLKLFGPDGRLKDLRKVENLVVNAGRSYVIDRMQSDTPAFMDYVAIGTGSTAPVAANTTLETETARQQGTLSQPDAYTDRVVETFAAGVGTGTITEAGRLNAAAAGTLMGRQTFGGIVKAAGDSLQVTYDFTYAAG